MVQGILIILVAYVTGAYPVETWVKQQIRYQVGWYLLLIDIGKGLIITLLAWTIGGFSLACLAAVVVVLGDLYSIFRIYQDGKGIAVAAGALVVLSPVLILIGILIYLLSLLLTRYLFLSTFFSTVAVMILSLALGSQLLIILVVLFVGIVIIHKQRVHWRRFRRGTEPTYHYRKPYW